MFFRINGGTGRFKRASGELTMREISSAVLFDALGNPLIFDATGEFEGKVSGVADDVGIPDKEE